MYCLANMCYVCLEKKSKSLSDINSSLSVNKDIIHIIGYLPFNLAWLKTMQILLICDECCLRLRETCQFLEKCLKNSALLQGYRDILNTENEAELLVKLNITHKDINEVECEIQSEDEEVYTFQQQPNIEEMGDVFVDLEEGIIRKKEVDDKQEYPTDNNSTKITEEMDDVFVNLEDYFVKEDNTWKREEGDDAEEVGDTEEVDDTEEYPTDNNSTDNMDNESDPEISVNDNAHLTNTECASSGITCKQEHVMNKNDLNTAAKKTYKYSTRSKSFVTKSDLNIHTRIHTDEKSYECAICNTCFSKKANLVVHMRVHTHEKPYNCSRCKKCFNQQLSLASHMRTHTGEKPYECDTCKKCFSHQSSLVVHMRIHTGKKPYECNTCKKCFSYQTSLVSHMRVHTGEKPYECDTCKKRFNQQSNLATHMRTHTGKKPYECTACKKGFSQRSNLMRHMRVHTDKKPSK